MEEGVVAQSENQQLLDTNLGKLVRISLGKTTGIGLLLKDELPSHSEKSGIGGYCVIRKTPEWGYSRVYFGIANCAVTKDVSGDGERATIVIDQQMGADMAFGPMPQYDCPLRQKILALEEALTSENRGKK